jgi:hypothetical protein
MCLNATPNNAELIIAEMLLKIQVQAAALTLVRLNEVFLTCLALLTDRFPVLRATAAGIVSFWLAQLHESELGPPLFRPP